MNEPLLNTILNALIISDRYQNTQYFLKALFLFCTLVWFRIGSFQKGCKTPILQLVSISVEVKPKI